MDNKRGNEPTDKVFEELRLAAIKVWSKYDDTYGYQTEKTTQVNAVKNYADNWYTFLGMLDSNNQAEFMKYIAYQETKDFLNANRSEYGYPAVN